MTTAYQLARAVRRLARPRGHGGSPARGEETCRLYERIEAHLERQRDGRIAVVAVPVEDAAGTRWYWVGELDPRPDFERQAGLEGG